MNVQTMEGIVGARINTDLMSTPMRVFNEASRKGDTATMERAMGYAGDLADEADKYKMKAEKGMEEDARAAREERKLEQEEAVQKAKESHGKPEESIDGNRKGDKNTDTVEISQEGKALSGEGAGPDNNEGAYLSEADGGKDPGVYTKTGEVIQTKQSSSISVSA